MVILFNKRKAHVFLPNLKDKADLNVGLYRDDPAFLYKCKDYFEKKWSISQDFNDKRFLCEVYSSRNYNTDKGLGESYTRETN